MRTRITVRPTGDRTNDLRVAANVRRDLWAHSPVEIDPDHPLHGTHRDEQERAYFEFSTGYPDEVTRVLRDYGHAERVEVREVEEPVGLACQNCGNVVGPVLPPVCPNCHFRDISACPVCHHEVPRQSYTRIGGDLFRCPQCHSQVRLRFNEPMFLGDGTYNQPLVVVEQA
jgi:Zn finger protein HypA/HybF involved in hydrogenase expression